MFLAQLPASAPKLPALPEGPTFERVRGPIEIPSYEPWQITLAILATIFFLAILTWQILRNRRKTSTPTPPYQVALAELETAEQLTDNDDERFAILCSQALRRYLEDALHLHSRARTSQEFLHNLKGNPHLDQNFQDTLAETLTQFDQIKFAQKPVSQEVRIHISTTVRQLIEQAHTITQEEGTHK
ncbi:DUF4381 family protein [Coraliomargarita algicola]|uniref:DUF4381 family protein n=1 Tax=Coraliomargarita algicola TaxID=3092156 RepID=A0ABZ0RR72_9BACT|nr:DUF4381 family protein [Coraliomargarita sp. J2-16]WPJ97480.1 DUF4381 family protein [Coraliomargarita sp. J2-16]